MRPRALGSATLLCLLALLLVGLPATASTRSAKTCVRPSGATVVRTSRYVVLYRRTLSTGNGLRILYWGCLRSTGKRTRLTEATGKADDAPIANTRFRTSRRYVTYVQTMPHQGTAVLYIQEFDLRTGRRAPGIPAIGISLGESLQRPDGTWSLLVADLAVSDAGGLAWLQVGQSTPTAPPGDSIVVHDRSGTNTIENAAPGALRGPTIAGDTVTWTTDGAPRTYDLKR